jgi:ketosteroid isomerase-like protein
MISKIFSVALAAMVLSGNIVYCDSTVDEIIRLEREWADAGPKRDVSTYEKILADDFIGQWADGSSSTKAETIADLRSNHDQYEAVELKDLKVRVYENTAVVTGMFYEKSTLGGHDATGLYRFTDVWVKKTDQWQVVAFQSLKLAKPAGQ